MISFKAILGFMFLLLIVTIAVLAVVSYQSNEESRDAAVRVDYTRQIIGKADDVLSAYQAARLSINKVIICKDLDLQVSYSESMNAVFAALRELRDLTVDDVQQQMIIDSLEHGLQKFETISDSLLRLVQTDRSDDQVAAVFSGSMELRDEQVKRISRIKASEEVLLTNRQLANQKSVEAFERTFILLLVGLFILLASTFLSIRYNFNKRQKAQEELTLTNALFEKVFYESPIALVISEFESGRILNCNRVFATTVNIEVKELIGKTPVELGIFESYQRRKEILSGAWQNGMVGHTEVYINPRNKERTYVSIQAHIISLYNSKCLLTAIMDLSSHKKAEEDTKKALQAEIELNKMKSSFVTLASHEFRTPLTTILSSAFLLETYLTNTDPQKIGKHLSRIKSSVNSLTSILDEFLSVAKIEEGQIKPNIETINVPRHMNNVCKNLRAFLRPGQSIDYYHQGNDEADTDPVLLTNIVNNLVTNSIKYSPENTPIRVSSMVNSNFHITVSDNGIGIPEADQKHLFERFFRASNAGTVQGTGLGLHIMKHYVDMLEGDVRVRSDVGKGTDVEVTLRHPE